MSKLRLYLDEDSIKAALIKALQNADLDVITNELVFLNTYIPKV